MKHLFQSAILPLLLAGLLISSCKKERSCESCINGNKSPVAYAGPDQVIVMPTDTTILDGSGSNDPDGQIKEWQWKKISGPASFNIQYADKSRTSLKNLAIGVYQFELMVKDNVGLTGKDTVQITVYNPLQPNQPPIAHAGPDQTINLPSTSITLNGNLSTDPDNNISNYLWTKIFGSSSFNIINQNSVQTQVTNLAEGVYLFELTVTDAAGLTARDTVQVTVLPGNTNLNNEYIAGYYSAVNGKTIARLWTNGIVQNLSNGQNDASANSVFVSGTDVYVAGFDGYNAILWKNGVAQTLMSGGSFPSRDSTAVITATSVFVNGNDVYVSGNIYHWVHLGGWAEGVLWKNGVRQHLDSLGSDYLANSVFVSNNDVYVAGMLFDFQSRYHATIWKNGIAQFLNDGQFSQTANSVYVAGNNVYAAGISGNSATTWEYGQAINLGTGTANSVFVSGSNVYVAGMLGSAATLWKNRQATILGTGVANSVFVSDNDVYVVGNKEGSATLWKNGVVNTLQGLTEASSVFVK